MMMALIVGLFCISSMMAKGVQAVGDEDSSTVALDAQGEIR